MPSPWCWPASSTSSEWVPFIHTLLSENERRRLVADVAPGHWPLAPGASKPPREGDETELDLQRERHTVALEPRETDGDRKENNYEQFVRYLVERDHLNERGRQAGPAWGGPVARRRVTRVVTRNGVN